MPAKPKAIYNHKERINKVVSNMRKALVPEKKVQEAVRKYWKEIRN